MKWRGMPYFYFSHPPAYISIFQHQIVQLLPLKSFIVWFVSRITRVWVAWSFFFLFLFYWFLKVARKTSARLIRILRRLKRQFSLSKETSRLKFIELRKKERKGMRLLWYIFSIQLRNLTIIFEVKNSYFDWFSQQQSRANFNRSKKFFFLWIAF